MTQRDVLMLFATRAAADRLVSVDDLVREFWISKAAACGSLTRLWRERLIEAVAARPPRARFRLEPGEAIEAFRFRITRRGRERLHWYERRDKGGDGGWLGLR